MAGGKAARLVVSSLPTDPILRLRPLRFCKAAARRAEPLTVRSDALDAAKGEEGLEEPVVPEAPSFLGVLSPVPA